MADIHLENIILIGKAVEYALALIIIVLLINEIVKTLKDIKYIGTCGADQKIVSEIQSDKYTKNKIRTIGNIMLLIVIDLAISGMENEIIQVNTVIISRGNEANIIKPAINLLARAVIVAVTAYKIGTVKYKEASHD